MICSIQSLVCSVQQQSSRGSAVSMRGRGKPSAAVESGPYVVTVTESTHICGYPGCSKRFRQKHNLLAHQTQAHGREPMRRNTLKKSSNDGEYYPGMDDYSGVD